MKKFKTGKFFIGLSAAALLTAIAPMAAASVQAAETSAEFVYGDVNGDNDVTVADAVAILQYIGNKDKYAIDKDVLSKADVYNRGDGVTARDALSIMKLDAGLITELPESWLEVQTTTTTGVTTTSSAVTTTTTSTAPDPQADITYIHLTGKTATVTGEHASVKDSVITIDHSGTFYVDGTLEDGQINVNIADETADPETVKIYLNGVNITAPTAIPLTLTRQEPLPARLSSRLRTTSLSRVVNSVQVSSTLPLTLRTLSRAIMISSSTAVQSMLQLSILPIRLTVSRARSLLQSRTARSMLMLRATVSSQARVRLQFQAERSLSRLAMTLCRLPQLSTSAAVLS